MSISKRDFLKLGSLAIGGTFAATSMPAILAAASEASEREAQGKPMLVLAPAEHAALAALADQIYPPDESPGAAAIGAVRFMDTALNGFMSGALVMVREGISDLDQKAVQSHPGVETYAELGFNQQTAVTQEIEHSAFFRTVHFMTMAGVFALPNYGGNQNHEGWRQIGFEHQHVWQPPFGHYDAQYTSERPHEDD